MIDNPVNKTAIIYYKVQINYLGNMMLPNKAN